MLISDLYEGGNKEEMLQRAATLVASGVQVIALLALSDRGTPSFDHNIAGALAGMGVPAFACTPRQISRSDGGSDSAEGYLSRGAIIRVVI